MKRRTETGIIYSLSCFAALILVLFPSLAFPFGFILRLLVFIGMAWLLYFYFTTLHTSEPKDELDDYLLETTSFSEAPQVPVDFLFNEIQSLVFEIVNSVNSNFKPGIYLFEGQNNKLIMQGNSDSYFSKDISVENSIVNQVLMGMESQTFYQKDFGKEWNDIFGDKPWRGSECIIAKSIRYNENPIGLFLLYIDHFNQLDHHSSQIVSQLSEILSKNLENLDNLDLQVSSNRKKEKILSFIADLDFKDDAKHIYQKFSALIQFFIPLDQIIISSEKTSSHEGIIDFMKEEDSSFEIGMSFDLKNSILGLPITHNGIIDDALLRDSYPDFIRNSDQNGEKISHSIGGFLIDISGQKWVSVILERKSGKPINQIEIQSLKTFMNILETVLKWQQEYKKIYLNATQDGLTGLLNHKTFKDRIDEEINRAKRFKHDLVVLMLDLDKFKRINDTLGHPYGDYVIKTVAKILKDNVRLIDVVARYGGEEFIIVLVNTNMKKALPVADRIVKNISEFPFSVDNNDVKMTISCGMSEYPKQSNIAQEIISYADQAMYKVKKMGGNQVMKYEV
ncbi:MAG: GGDEF domain-containing protein [Candidatus Marinimicrobia bacterium]|jgi:diguanylate cyclase (GGDEF)-like protein|nr:GGDEF domain-containing protein [Candidatus Neomarinimicrobiota bacterium]